VSAAPVYDRHGVTVHHGDNLDVLAAMPAGSIHAVVCDPPYNLGFMGRAWDTHDTPAAFQEWCRQWAVECLRVLTPGGHLLAFGATRTSHRLAAGIEDAGFEIRDTITWLYGSGFPKSLDVSKAIDKAAGAEREVIGEALGGAALKIGGANPRPWHERQAERGGAYDVTAPATEAAREWDGWGTALKPSAEPVVVARKPLSGTVAATVLAHGTGALNVGGCRTAHASAADLAESQAKNHGRGGETFASDTYGAGRPQQSVNVAGRWPTNVVLDEAAAAALDAQSGTSKSPPAGNMITPAGRQSGSMSGPLRGGVPSMNGYGDSGGASRFFPVFRYEAKAPTSERPRIRGQVHPTVKPLGLMRWLVRLVTPPGGIVCDPFAGTGTTGHAARAEGFRAVLIELDDEHIPLIVSRLDGYRDATTAPVDAVTGLAEPMDLLDLLTEDEAS
jgi:DNA modification methylase